MKVNRVEAGKYQTEDGRFSVEKDFREEPCMGPHPVQIARDEREKIMHALTEHHGRAYDVIRFAQTGFDSEAIHAVAEGRKGWHCPGDSDHLRWGWQVWDEQTDDYAGDDGVHVFETKKEAVEWMNEKFYGVESAATRRFREAMASI